MHISAFVPTLQLAPIDIMLSQWKHVYDEAQKGGPAFGLFASLSFLFTAYTLRQERPSADATWKTFAILAALPVAIVPYTLFVMSPTDKTLLDAEASPKPLSPASEKSAREAIGLWAKLNQIRGMFPLTAGVIGLWTVFSM